LRDNRIKEQFPNIHGREFETRAFCEHFKHRQVFDKNIYSLHFKAMARFEPTVK